MKKAKIKFQRRQLMLDTTSRLAAERRRLTRFLYLAEKPEKSQISTKI
jgi:hypothetical protein